MEETDFIEEIIAETTATDHHYSVGNGQFIPNTVTLKFQNNVLNFSLDIQYMNGESKEQVKAKITQAYRKGILESFSPWKK